jgi:hypothetical protein
LARPISSPRPRTITISSSCRWCRATPFPPAFSGERVSWGDSVCSSAPQSTPPQPQPTGNAPPPLQPSGLESESLMSQTHPNTSPMTIDDWPIGLGRSVGLKNETSKADYFGLRPFRMESVSNI